MQNASLRAVPEVLVLDEATPTKSTTVYYQRPFTFERIWERVAGRSWNEVDLDRRATGNPGWELAGSFASPAIAAGERYEVVIHADDPNESLLSDVPPPAAWCTGIGARAELHQDSRFRCGGTWIGAATYPSRRVELTVEVGQRAPLALPDGHSEFDPPVRMHRSLHADVTELDLTLQDLWISPGTTYWMLVRAVDEHGQWDELLGELTTLRRRVVVSGRQLVVHNDGDPGGTGECSFLLSLVEAGAGERASWQRQIGDIGDGTVVSLRGVFGYDSGLSAGGGAALRMHLGGVEYDSEIEGGNETVMGSDSWVLPRGPRYEALAPIDWTVRADVRHPDDDFEFSVELTRSVDYA